MIQRGGSLAVAAVPLGPRLRVNEGGRRPTRVRKAGPTIAGQDRRDPGPEARAAASRQVARFLEDFGIGPSRRRNQVMARCVARAVQRWRHQPDLDLGSVAVEQAEMALDNWFAVVLGPELIGDQQPLLVGAVAYRLCHASTCWPQALLVYERLPRGFVAAMREAAVAPLPEESPGRMIEQPLEPWSFKGLLSSLRAWWHRGPSGRPAPAA